MKATRERARSIFLHAVENHPAGRWDAYLAEACGGDAELKQRVRKLLDAHLGEDSLLDHPGPPEPHPGTPSEPGPGPEEVLGDFRLLRRVGRGGMGVVYEAEQISLRRRVALKVLPLAAVLDERHLKRFRVEAQAAGQLHHTNIVPVYAVGCERGVHYYAMQFIDGQPLSSVIEGLRGLVGEATGAVPGLPRGGIGPTAPALATTAADGQETAPFLPNSGPNAPDPTVPDAAPAASPPDPSADPSVTGLSPGGSAECPAYVRSVARLGVQAAEALEHAHSHGVIHRDVKPANLLLDSRGNLWVADFGLARLQDDRGLTMTGDVLGTLRYMSPEQAAGSRELDHRTDVYSLGATLYELLALRPAVAGEGHTEILRAIAHGEPRPLRRWNRAVPRDLETIVAKALAKEPARRYATAGAVAADLRAFLEHRPISARRPGPVERAVKWVRRHRVASAAALCVMAASLVAMASALVAHQRRIDALAARLDAQKADQARLEARVDALVEEAQRLGTGRRPDFTRAVALLTEALGHRPGDADLYLYRGGARHELGRHAEAIADFERSLELRPRRNAAAHWMIALAALQLGQVEQARKHQEQAGREDPDDVRSLVAQALALAHEERGLTLMDRAIEREPFDPTLYFYRGRIAANLTFRRGESRFYERAVDDLEKALLARPGDPKILAPLCDVLLHATELGDLTGWARAKERAARLLGEWRKARPDDRDALWLLMSNDLQRGDPRHCVELAKEGQRRLPNDAVFPLNMAWAYVQLNDLDAAEKSYDRAIELQPTLLALTGRALCRGHDRGDDAKTVRELAELRRQNPPATWTYGDFGAFFHAYIVVRDHGAAVSVCDDYLRLVPGSPQVHVRRANALHDLRDAPAAQAAYTRALELNPNNWHLYQERAWAYEIDGQHEKALTDVDRYLSSPAGRPRDGRFSPDQLAKLAEAVGGRGAILHRVGRHAEAERDERECLALHLKIEGEGLAEAVVNAGGWDLNRHYGQLAMYVPRYCRPDDVPAVFRAIRPEPPKSAKANTFADLGELFAALAPRLAAAGAKRDQERAWRQAAELFRRAAEDAGYASPRWQRDRARCLAALAALLREAGRGREADEQDRAAHDAARRWQQWIESFPEPSPDAKHDAVGAFGLQLADLALFLADRGTKVDRERAWAHAAALFRRASETSGPVSRWDRLRARCHAELASLMRAAGRDREADEQDRSAAEAARRWRERTDRFLAGHPDDTSEQAGVAWLLVTWPVPALRDPARAIELARKAVEREPNRWEYWGTLGIALYRNGDLDGAAEALGKARASGGRDDTRSTLALAMAQWQRGRRAEARALYDEAVKALRDAGPEIPDEAALLLRETSNLLGRGPEPPGHVLPPAGPEPPPG